MAEDRLHGGPWGVIRIGWERIGLRWENQEKGFSKGEKQKCRGGMGKENPGLRRMWGTRTRRTVEVTSQGPGMAGEEIQSLLSRPLGTSVFSQGLGGEQWEWLVGTRSLGGLQNRLEGRSCCHSWNRGR